MSVNAGVEGQGDAPVTEPVQPTGTPQSETPTGKPYDQYLAELPETLRPVVEPVFQEWDKGVTQRFQELHQQYDPWKPVLESGFDPSVTQQSLQLVQALENSPEQVVKALAEAYGVQLGESKDPASATPDPTGDEGDDPFTDPRLKQHEEMLQTMGQYLLQQQQEQQQAEEDKLLEKTLSDLHSQHGQFDDQYVLALMAQGATPDQAVKSFNDRLQQFIADQKAEQAPVVVGSGGGVPASTVDPSTLNGKDTKSLVVQLLQAANQQG